MKENFYICNHCGNIVSKLTDSGVSVFCCGEKMNNLVAGTTDASLEKHVPVYKVDASRVFVSVGAIEHPMTEDHFIEWIYLKTKNGAQINHLKPLDKPETYFSICEGDEVESVYAYCNLHSLWKS